MAIQSKLQELLPQGYGYIIFLVADSIFINIWLAMKVGKARKEYKIPYPIMYAADNTKGSDGYKFNCIQRAHQHTLEWHPTFMTLILIGGLQHPKIAAGAGLVYLAGRVAYAVGYHTGEPEKRKWGGFGMPALLVLLGTSMCFAGHQLDWTLPLPAFMRH